MLGAPPAAPIRILTVRRGSGFNEAGTVLLEAGALRRLRLTRRRLCLFRSGCASLDWGQTAVRGEGGGVVRDGLVRFLATLFLEKQFGREGAAAELMRQRLASAQLPKGCATISATP